MALSPERFHQHAMQAADDAGRLPLSRMTAWDVFPFVPAGLQVAPLAAPSAERPRPGADPAECSTCRSDAGIWRNDDWRVVRLDGAGVPLLLMLFSRAHLDLADLPDELAGQFGRLLVHLARAVESLPHVARAHVSRWGDGHAHLHTFVYARPAGFPQLRGTCLAVWDDLLPPYPDEVAEQDAEAVARALAAGFGGEVLVGDGGGAARSHPS